MGDLVTAELFGVISLTIFNFNGYIVPFCLKLSMLKRSPGGSRLQMAVISCLVSFFVVGGCIGLVHTLFSGV